MKIILLISLITIVSSAPVNDNDDDSPIAIQPLTTTGVAPTVTTAKANHVVVDDYDDEEVCEDHAKHPKVTKDKPKDSTPLTTSSPPESTPQCTTKDSASTVASTLSPSADTTVASSVSIPSPVPNETNPSSTSVAPHRSAVPTESPVTIPHPRVTIPKNITPNEDEDVIEQLKVSRAFIDSAIEILIRKRAKGETV